MVDKEVQGSLPSQKWVKRFGDVAAKEVTWLVAKKCTKETRLIMLQWKILHNIYPTRILLKKMKKVNDELCIECNMVEDIEHFFFNCKGVEKLWKQVYLDLIDKSVLTVQDCILGRTDGTYCNHDNLLILIAKMCISKYRYGDYSNLLLLYDIEKNLRLML